MHGDLLKQQIECITYKAVKGKRKHLIEGREGV